MWRGGGSIAKPIMKRTRCAHQTIGPERATPDQHADEQQREHQGKQRRRKEGRGLRREAHAAKQRDTEKDQREIERFADGSHYSVARGPTPAFARHEFACALICVFGTPSAG